MIDWNSNLDEEKMWNLFKYFDVNNVGFITKEDLKEATAREGRRLKPQDLEAMISEIDSAKNGTISFEDFKKMMVNEIDLAPIP